MTGANGFVGRHVADALAEAGHSVMGLVRRQFDGFDSGRHVLQNEGRSFRQHLEGTDAVVHTAAVAHRTSGSVEELREDFQKGNVEQTRLLTEAVAESSVSLMIHISSIAAAGMPGSFPEGIVISEEVETGVYNDYGQSKRDAEVFVNQLAGTGKVGINLRSPLIYGTGARGNWPKLLGLVRKPIPLPFGSVQNRRSYLGIENLCDLVRAMVEQDLSPSQSGIYHVADSEIVSLREIVFSIREALGRSPGLLPFPPFLLSGALKILGRDAMADGLFGDLILDASKVRETFAWKPVRSTLDGMVRSL